MHIKGKQVQKEEVHGKVLLTMSIIMLYMIPMILQGVEYLVLYLPPASAAPDKLSYVVRVDGYVCYPTVMIGNLAFINQPVLKIVRQNGFLVAI